jgi:hypothetical protein
MNHVPSSTVDNGETPTQYNTTPSEREALMARARALGVIDGETVVAPSGDMATTDGSDILDMPPTGGFDRHEVEVYEERPPLRERIVTAVRTWLRSWLGIDDDGRAAMDRLDRMTDLVFDQHELVLTHIGYTKAQVLELARQHDITRHEVGLVDAVLAYYEGTVESLRYQRSRAQEATAPRRIVIDRLKAELAERKRQSQENAAPSPSPDEQQELPLDAPTEAANDERPTLGIVR